MAHRPETDGGGAEPAQREIDAGLWMLLRGNSGLAVLLTGDRDAARQAFREELALCRDLWDDPAGGGRRSLPDVRRLHPLGKPRTTTRSSTTTTRPPTRRARAPWGSEPGVIRCSTRRLGGAIPSREALRLSRAGPRRRRCRDSGRPRAAIGGVRPRRVWGRIRSVRVASTSVSILRHDLPAGSSSRGQRERSPLAASAVSLYPAWPQRRFFPTTRCRRRSGRLGPDGHPAIRGRSPCRPVVPGGAAYGPPPASGGRCGSRADRRPPRCLKVPAPPASVSRRGQRSDRHQGYEAPQTR